MVSATRRRWWRRSERTEDRTLTRDNLPGVMFASGPDLPGTLTPERALEIADVWACVQAIVGACSTLPLHLYRRRGEDRERVMSHEVVHLLGCPGPTVPTYSFLGGVFGSLVLNGDAFIAKYRDEANGVHQLGVIDPAHVTIELRGGMPLYTITFPVSGRQKTVGEADLRHVRSPLSLDGILGVSPLRAARTALGVARSGEEYGAAVLANGATLRGVVSVPAGVEADEALANLRDGFEARHKGPAAGGKLAFVSGEVSLTSLSLSPADLEFVKQRQLSTAEVARIFGVPPSVINAPSNDSLTYSTTEGESIAFLRALDRWLVAAEQSLSIDRDLTPPNHYWEFDRRAALRVDTASRADVYTKALSPQTGWMTRAEVRRLENLAPEPVEAAAA